MKLVISEKQLKSVFNRKNEISEVDAPSPQPTAGTSSTQSGGAGYPDVGKWETGATRGPANQIGVTKWADVVGATLKRGKANPLK